MSLFYARVQARVSRVTVYLHLSRDQKATLCGRPINFTWQLWRVDADELPTPTCEGCYEAAGLKRAAGRWDVGR